MTVNTEKLVRMAEQITANMNYIDDKDKVAARVADHITKFWDERMTKALIAYAATHKGELSAELQGAVSKLE